MKFREIPQGNGQVVYIDQDWINGEDEQNFIFRIPSKIETPVKIIRKEMIKYLFDCGYVVITDSALANDDTFFFSPCFDKHINSCLNEYENKKINKIKNCLAEGSIEVPFTISFPESSFPNKLPSLPFVLKNEYEEGGKEKFLIENSAQLEIFKKFYEEINIYDRKQREKRAKAQYSFIDNLEFDENGKSKNGLYLILPDYKKKLHKYFVIQKFINTPTKYNTSLRVVTSSSGHVLCASLKYSKESDIKKDNYDGLFDRYLANPESPYYLNSKSIISNTIAGGNSILLGKNNYSDLEQVILLEHGIDPNNAVVPFAVAASAINIAIKCRREIGSISGMDFIYDKDEKAWKYLEQQEYPMLNTYSEAYGLPYYTDVERFFETNRIADIDSRLNALSLTMKNKYILSDESQKVIKYTK